MPRHGENIYKRRDGRWEGRFLCGHTAENKPRYRYVYAHTYRDVREKLTAIQSGKSQPSAEDALFGAHRCAEISALWLEHKRPEVKLSTFAHYRHLIESHIIPHLGTQPVERIDDLRISRYIRTLLERGRLDDAGGLSPKTVSDILILLKSILRYAGRLGLRVNVHFEQLRVRRPAREMRVLSAAEQSALASLFEHSADGRCVGVMLSLYTGMRLGEVCALQWKHIDLQTQTIHVRKTMQRIRMESADGRKTSVIITDPKSASSVRDIPFPKFLLPVLERAKVSSEAYVLSGCADRYVEPRSMENFFARSIAECGLPAANYHALRHSFATRCVELGFDIKSLSEILGHSNVSITLDRYVHSSLAQKRRNMNMLQPLA